VSAPVECCAVSSEQIQSILDGCAVADGGGEWRDRRIPLSPREPLANYCASPGNLTHPWLRSAAKWHQGTMLEAGTLRSMDHRQPITPELHRQSFWRGLG
jgi:hypothetical protein